MSHNGGDIPNSPSCWWQYFFNYSNASAVEWALAVSETGPLGTGSPYVLGTFLDDTQGFSWEHPHAPNNTGIGPVGTAVLQNATQAFTQLAIERLQASGAYLWQALQTVRLSFGSERRREGAGRGRIISLSYSLESLITASLLPAQRGTGDPDYFGLPPSSGGAACTAWMETACAPSMQVRFLIVRACLCARGNLLRIY
jgi:hypothetical protein